MCIIQLSFESGLTEHRKKALIVSVLVLYNICLNSVSLLYKVLTTVLGRRGGGGKVLNVPWTILLYTSTLAFFKMLSSLLLTSPLCSTLLSFPVQFSPGLTSPPGCSLLCSPLVGSTVLYSISTLLCSCPLLSFPLLFCLLFFFPILGLGLICKARDISLQRTTLMRLEPALAYRDLPLKNLTSLLNYVG